VPEHCRLRCLWAVERAWLVKESADAPRWTRTDRALRACQFLRSAGYRAVAPDKMASVGTGATNG
jgi:hypothetical protein